MRRRILVFALIACLLLPAAARAETEKVTGKNLLYNADFSVASADAPLPAGWDFEAYLSAADDVACGLYDDEEKGACIRIENFVSNDTRVIQNVEVEPVAYYRLSAYVRTEEIYGDLGATLSIDNYAIDRTFCYSEDLFGTEDWSKITLFVLTGPEQTILRVALRLGGYSMQAEGTAYFSNVSLVQCSDVGDNDFVDLERETGNSGGGAAAEGGLRADGTAMFTWMLLLTAGTLLLFGLLYVRVFRAEADMLETPEKPRIELCLLLGAALILRVILSVIFVGHSTDINCFMAWGNAMLSGGPANFYTSGMFADYPPGYMYVLWLLSAIGRLLGLNYGSTGFVLLFKLPATIADLVTAGLIYRLAKQRGIRETFALILAALFAFNPAAMFISGAWGQIDSVLTLGIVLAAYLFLSDKRILAGAVYGLAILLKPQALMFGPLLAVAYIVDIIGSPEWKKRLLKTVLAVLAALSVIAALSLPFQSTQNWDWLIGKYVSTTAQYPYASIEAFNFPALIGGNWARVETTVLGVSYQIWGTVFIVLAVAGASFLYCRSRKSHAGALYLTGALMIAMIFTFGHFMHERYLFPVLALLLVAYLYERDRRILVSFGVLTASLLINVLAAMYIVDHQQLRGTYYNAVTAIGSALEVLGFAFLAYTCIRILLQDQTLKVHETPKKKRPVSVDNTPLSILPAERTDQKLHYTRNDYVLLLLLVAVYGAAALFNLGTLKAPETCWEPATLGESVTVEFDGEYTVSEYWVYCNIGNDGTMLLTADGGFEQTYKQTYDDMFRWKRFDCNFTADKVELQLYSGALQLNEIAFFDETGARIPAAVHDPEGTQAYLLDEQDTVPEEPLYYNGMYFDELYHGRTAYEHLHGLKPYENSHPPLGKLLIAAGIAVFGMNPFGWRIVGALIGIAMLPILYAFGKRMFRKTTYAFVMTALFAFDFMHFTQTRIATIDVYAVFFILLMFYYMYRYISMNFFVDDLWDTLKPLALGGIFFSFGAASKWICIYAGGGMAVLFFGSLIARYHEYRQAMDDGTKSEQAAVRVFYKNTLLTLLWCILFYIIIPALIYFLSYTPYYLYEAGQNASYGLRDMLNTFWYYQDFMFSYHSGLQATHPYQSSWWQWPFTLKPMWYYFSNNAASGTISTLSASGNPAVWWVGSVGAVILLVERIFGRVKKDAAQQILCVGVLANFLPWVLVSRCTFIYHFFATVPFILMAAVYALCKWEEKEPRIRFVKWVWLGIGLLFFLLLYPGISGYPIPAEWGALLKNLPGGTLMYGA